MQTLYKTLVTSCLGLDINISWFMLRNNKTIMVRFEIHCFHSMAVTLMDASLLVALVITATLRRIATLTWWRGLSIPTILRAVLSGALGPGRVCMANWSQGRGQTKSDSNTSVERHQSKLVTCCRLLQLAVLLFVKRHE